MPITILPCYQSRQELINMLQWPVFPRFPIFCEVPCLAKCLPIPHCLPLPLPLCRTHHPNQKTPIFRTREAWQTSFRRQKMHSQTNHVQIVRLLIQILSLMQNLASSHRLLTQTIMQGRTQMFLSLISNPSKSLNSSLATFAPPRWTRVAWILTVWSTCETPLAKN